ncbi:MAG: 30S ribosomal protein S6 [Acidimicrobiales bacterium]
MRPYEVMMIFDAGAEAPTIQAVLDRLLESIRAHEGVPGHVDRWGRRPFAYEVKHRREGYYVLLELSGEPRTVAEIDRLLTLADEVLRFKVIRLPDKIAARLASGAASHARPSARGPAPRQHAGHAPSPNGSSGGDEGSQSSQSGQAGEAVADEAAAEGARATADQEDQEAATRAVDEAPPPVDEAPPPGAGPDTVAPAAG